MVIKPKGIFFQKKNWGFLSLFIHHMDLATEEATLRFLEGLWFRNGQAIINVIINEYNLNEEQIELLENKLMKPNDWIVNVLPSLSK